MHAPETKPEPEQYEPVEQKVQSVTIIKPLVAPYVPAGHVTGAVPVGQYDPNGHSACVAIVAPLLHVQPAWHGAHDDWPGSELYVAAPHSVGAGDAAAQYEPAGHTALVDVVLPATQYEPARHTPVTDVRPVVAQYRPAVQSVQDVMAGRPVLPLNRPVGHAVGEVVPAVQYEPAGQSPFDGYVPVGFVTADPPVHMYPAVHAPVGVLELLMPVPSQ